MSKNTILIRSYLNIKEEKIATAVAITPGALVERTSAGLVQAHSTAAGKAEGLFALEDDFQGKGIDDAYAVSSLISCLNTTPGDRIYAIPTGAIAVGEFVESAGDGTVTAFSAGDILGVCIEAAAGGRVIIQIV